LLASEKSFDKCPRFPESQASLRSNNFLIGVLHELSTDKNGLF